MLNLKYHIVSLVAVFCALGIGIFVGSNLVGDDIFADQQKQLVTRLEEEFNLLREQNRDTESQLAVFKDTTDDYRLFCEQISPLIISDKLAQQSVAVIQMNTSVPTEKVVKTLEDSGAEIAYSVSFDWKIQPDWNLFKLPDDKKSASKKENYKRLAEQISTYLRSGTDTPELKALRESGFLSVSGTPGNAVHGVVILEGSNEDNTELLTNFNTPVVDSFVKGGVKVVVGESQGMLFSTLEAYKLRPVTTIDNIDSSIGLTSMVFSLTGKEGHYGTGHTADRLIPEIN